MYDFLTDLEYSMGERERFDIDLLKRVIPDAVSVCKTDVAQDKKGVDYSVRLSGGATINIDAKTRRSINIVDGSPELALELWSVVPRNGNAGKAGWTWNTETNVDLILYTFPTHLWDRFYLFPFHHLRVAFITNGKRWFQNYRHSVQKNKGWDSACLFVPAREVIRAVLEQMSGRAE